MESVEDEHFSGRMEGRLTTAVLYSLLLPSSLIRGTLKEAPSERGMAVTRPFVESTSGRRSWIRNWAAIVSYVSLIGQQSTIEAGDLLYTNHRQSALSTAMHLLSILRRRLSGGCAVTLVSKPKSFCS